jgi:hypothetical protein
VIARRREWPPFLSPGWLAAYTIGLLGWLAIFTELGLAGVIAIGAGGLWVGAVIGEWLHRFPGEDDR